MVTIDFKAIRNAKVYLRSIEVGLLRKISDDQYSFQYNTSYLTSSNAIAISRSFPLQDAPFLSSKLHPFFDNLITEGWLLEYTEKIFHIDKTNRFGLLMATGKAPIGAVTVEPLDEKGNAQDNASIFQDDLSAGKLISYSNQIGNIFSFCPTCFRALENGKGHRKCVIEMWGTTKNIEIELTEERPIQLFTRVIYGGSISGAQRKGIFRLDARKGILTSTSVNAQFILKPEGEFPELPLNEHVTMAIAKTCGFNVPPFTLLKFDKLGYVFAIKRFDRTKDGTPLMAEDMGQVIQVPSSDKYDSSCERVAKNIAQYSSAPIVDLTDFFRRIVFCFLTANADMHLKNWSILENEKQMGTFSLSPCYDLLNTRLPIPNEQIDIGLPIGGKSRNLRKSYFESLAERIKIPPNQIMKTFEDVPKWAEVARKLVPNSLLSDEFKKEYLEIIETRVATLLV
jgi:serine/threonine-protein kinase HipA